MKRIDDKSVQLAKQHILQVITMNEYIERTLIECSISALQEVEINPDIWLTSAPLDKEFCEKYGLEG